jgi:hypothetical protein
LTVFFTSILSNYLGRALLLAESVALHHADAFFRIYIYDYENLVSGSLDSLLAFVNPVCAQRIAFYSSRDSLPLVSLFDNRYTVVEACTAVKPFIARRLLNDHACVVYLDPDCCVYSPLYSPSAPPASAAWSLQLTPHSLAPALNMPLSERLFLNYGVFNLGYFAVRPTSEALLFIDWWCKMVDFYGVDSPSSGNFVDQKPLDLAPAFISRLDIVRQPGWNVAWWNLFCDGRCIQPNHTVSFDGSVYPLAFYHFSNLDRCDDALVARPLERISSAKGSLTLSAHPLLRALYDTYLASLDSLNRDVARSVSFSNPLVGFGSRGWFGRLVNSELYRLMAKPDANSALSSSSYNSRGYSLVFRVYLLLSLASRRGVGFRRNAIRAAHRFVVSLLSPSLFDFSSVYR